MLYDSTISASLLDTFYIGGGTPSLIPNKDLEKLFAYLQKKNLLSKFKEITLEVNPESLQVENTHFYKALGINRISIGIQSFDNTVLEKLGRLSDSAANKKAIEVVQKYFNNFSLDLIYGIPGQNMRKELQSALDYHPPHFSLYCLTLAKNTPLYLEKKLLQLPDTILNQLFSTIHDKLINRGYNHYEISNYALTQYEAKHNLHYWRKEHYLGLGANASGYLDNTRYTNFLLKDYINSLENNQFPVKESDLLTEKDHLIEKLLLGLRLQEGVDFPEMQQYKKLKVLLNQFQKKNWITITDDTHLTPNLAGWKVLDYMVQSLYNTLE